MDKIRGVVGEVPENVEECEHEENGPTEGGRTTMEECGHEENVPTEGGGSTVEECEEDVAMTESSHQDTEAILNELSELTNPKKANRRKRQTLGIKQFYTRSKTQRIE